MYFTRFGYFIIFSIIAVAVAAIAFVVWPQGDSGAGSSATASPTTAAAPVATVDPTPILPFDRVVNFASFGAVLNIEIDGQRILVNLRPDFDVSGLNTTSHTFITTLPPGQNSVEEALRASGVEVNGPTGVPVTRR